jgi:gliding motility-associated-like protein
VVKLDCVTDTTAPRTIVVVARPKPNVRLLTPTVCPNEPVRLSATVAGAFVYEPEGLTKDSTNANLTFRFLTSGTKTIRFRVYGLNRDCYTDTLLRVTVRPSPKARDLDIPKAICPNDVVELSIIMERPAITYEWFVSSPQQPVIRLNGPRPTLTFKNSGLYDIEVKFSDGTCRDSLQSFNAIQVANCQVGFPQVFTPNGDGISDRWVPFGGDGVKKITYRILDLNGTTIFFEEDVNPNDLTRGWDGTNRQQQPAGEGTYIYQADVFMINSDKPKHEEGTIKLLRHKLL